MDKKRIVILGAGFAGVRVALDLCKQNLKNTQIVLVNQNPVHEYHADLYEVAASFLPEGGGEAQQELRYENLEGTVSIPLEKIFDRKNIEILVSVVLQIDLEKKIVTTEKENLGFDILVIALGSTTNYFGIESLEERGLPLKTTEDALNIRNSIDELFIRKNREDAIEIVVGGGGFTGCELSGELVGYLNLLAKLHGHDSSKIRVSIIEACPNLLNGADSWFQAKARERLEKLGVSVHLNSKIVEVSEKEIICADGQKVAYDLLIWTAGVKGNDLLSEINSIELQKNACLGVDPFLHLAGKDFVFAIGDNTFCYDSAHACVVPPTAQSAVAQGRNAAVNITRTLKGVQLEKFQPSLPSFIIPIGKNFALAEIFGLKLEGRAAWWLKRFVSLRYFLSILGVRQAVSLWFSGVSYFIK